MVTTQRILFMSLISFIFLFPIIPSFVQGIENPSTYTELDELSKQVYDLTKIKQYDKAKQKLETLANLFAEKHSDKEIDIEKLEVITRTIVNGKRAFAATELNDERLIWHALQIRLMIDALTHDNQPIWKNYYSTYGEQVNKLLLHTSNKDLMQFNKILEKNYQLYLTLRPAILVTHSMQTIEMLDSLYKFLITESKQNPPPWEEVEGGLQQLKHSIQKVFMGDDESALASHFIGSSPYVIIIGIASIVISTLTYVGWRKYKGEKRNISKRKAHHRKYYL